MLTLTKIETQSMSLNNRIYYYCIIIIVYRIIIIICTELQMEKLQQVKACVWNITETCACYSSQF